MKKAGTLILFCLAGILASLLYTRLYHIGLTVTWKQTGSLPERVASVDGVQKGYLYVRTVHGSQYAYLVDPDFAEIPEYSWQPVSARIIADESRAPDDKWKSLPLLRDAKQIYEAQIIYNIEGTAYLKLAQGNNGSLWLWKVTRPWGESIFLPWFIVPGLGAGLLAWALTRLLQLGRAALPVIGISRGVM